MDRIQDLVSPTTAAHAASVVVGAWVFYQYSQAQAPWFVLLLANLALLIWTDLRDGGTDPWALHVAAGGFLLTAGAALTTDPYVLTGVVAIGVCTVAQGLDWRHGRKATPSDTSAEDVTRP